jgi:hypothetical protein
MTKRVRYGRLSLGEPPEAPTRVSQETDNALHKFHEQNECF